jgi:putative transposase
LSCREKSILAIEDDSDISLSRKASLLDIARSSLYYEPRANEENILIMNAIDKIYTEAPFYGHRKILPELKEKYGFQVGKKKVLSLMKKMCLYAVYPQKKPDLSRPHPEHKKFPYLLSGLKIIRPNHVWGTDITYIRLKNHFAYLVAILDWFSRYVVAWKLSPTLETFFCVQTLEEALQTAIADIHNSDQGVQFTDRDYIAALEKNEIRISMDGRGRCMDNIFTERLWRTIKYENVYLNEYADFDEANDGLIAYFQFYNERRRHQSLDYRTPSQVYFQK